MLSQIFKVDIYFKCNTRYKHIALRNKDWLCFLSTLSKANQKQDKNKLCLHSFHLALLLSPACIFTDWVVNAWNHAAAWGKLCKWHCYWHSVYIILMLVGLFSNLTEVRYFCKWVSNYPIRHRLIWLMDTAAIHVQNSLLIMKKWQHSFPKGLKQTDCGATPREAKFHKIPNQRRLDHRPTLRTGLCLPYSAMPPKKVTDEWSRVGKCYSSKWLC